MNHARNSIRIATALCASLVAVAGAQTPVGTAFTYQGRLSDGGQAADGTYDFAFQLFDDPIGANQVGAGLCLDDVEVVDGLFTVELDFDQEAYGPDTRWLKILVRPDTGAGCLDATGYTALAPFRKLTSAPNSRFAGSAADATIGGGRGNLASNIAATASGGTDNHATGQYSTIGGGVENVVSNTGATVGGGGSNEANGGSSTVAGGSANVAGSNFSVVGGGSANIIFSQASSSGILGGDNNSARGAYSAIGGGNSNISYDNYGTIAGGFSNTTGTADGNTTNDVNATVSGGQQNTAVAYASSIGGGLQNQVEGMYGAVGGGYANSAFGEQSTIAGGHNNSADALGCAIGGGEGNLATPGGSFAAIAGGSENFVGTFNKDLDMDAKGFVPTDQEHSAIGGGYRNTITAAGGTIAGGIGNAVQDIYGTVGGGANNGIGGQVLKGGVSGSGGTIAGGTSNVVEGIAPAIGGGGNNYAATDYSVIAGGQSNAISDNLVFKGATTSTSYSAIGGGQNNVINASYATIAGGLGNYVAQYGSVVGGGASNTSGPVLFKGVASDFYYTTIGGGFDNDAERRGATVGGGESNEISAKYGTIPGGFDCTVAGDYSLAAGRQAAANAVGSFVWGDSTAAAFSRNTANEFAARASGGVRFYTASNLSTGVQVNAGSGTWSSVSDRNAKENIEEVESRAVLEKIAAMPVATWNYRTEEGDVKHMGPMAQDFRAAFGLGVDDKSITTVDADGVSLAAIKGLYEVVKEKDAKISAQEAKIASLEERLANIEKALSATSAAN